jgi:hypothetical protein
MNGMPLLENAVCSGLSVAERLGGMNRPWKVQSLKEFRTQALKSWTHNAIKIFLMALLPLIFVMLFR